MFVYEAKLTYRRTRKPWPYQSIKDASALVSYLTGAFEWRRDQEQLWAVFVDRKHHPLGRMLVSLGTRHSVLVDAADVLRPAILAGATAFMVAHNHPSGDTRPNDADLSVARTLCRAGATIGVQCLDFVIVGKCEGELTHFSLWDSGEMSQCFNAPHGDRRKAGPEPVATGRGVGLEIEPDRETYLRLLARAEKDGKSVDDLVIEALNWSLDNGCLSGTDTPPAPASASRDQVSDRAVTLKVPGALVGRIEALCAIAGVDPRDVLTGESLSERLATLLDDIYGSPSEFAQAFTWDTKEEALRAGRALSLKDPTLIVQVGWEGGRHAEFLAGRMLPSASGEDFPRDGTVVPDSGGDHWVSEVKRANENGVLVTVRQPLQPVDDDESEQPGTVVPIGGDFQHAQCYAECPYMHGDRWCYRPPVKVGQP